nr:2-C-methyl-D-erythritol 2,4-cyclodiphosphate synthase [Alphaproteobacteria bacterium]
VVIAKGDEALYDEAIAPIANSTLAIRATHILNLPVSGGKTRQASVRAGLIALNISEKANTNTPDHVLIHDAARPFISSEIIDRCIDQLHDHRACLVAIPVSDTIKKANDDGHILQTIDRSSLWAAQTPQGFEYGFIAQAHDKAHKEGRNDFTDDAAVAEWAGAIVHIVEGDSANIKLTTKEDLTMAEKSLSRDSTPPLTDFRVGTGYDVHAFDDGNAVIIGGVSIPHNRKLKGHSDADVGLHAITDAILGAIADGDIGTHFPPSDPQWKGAASDLFLKDAVRRIDELSGKLSNIDLTLICEEPKIGPHRPAMRESIAKICNISEGRVSVKATTSEKLGFTGRKEGIAALASVLVRLPEMED